jgi:DedD protein
MDSRLKERLIGAAVLVAVGVWLIPWVLDGPPDAADPDSVALQLPTPQEAAPMRSQTLRLNPESSSGNAATRPAEGTATSAPPPHERAPAAAVPAPVDQERAAEAPATASVPPRTAAETAAPAASRSAPPAGGDWVVQLGSFGDAENAQRLASRVGTYGYDARVSDFRAGGRTMHRVRVGPHATRDQAETVASSLSAHGFVAQVVTAD